MNSHFVDLLSIASGHPIENIYGNYLKRCFLRFQVVFFFGLLKAIFVKANTVEPVSECLAQKLSCRKFQGTESYSGEFLS